jgi:hypothetical protein
MLNKFNERFKILTESILTEWSSSAYSGEVPRPPRLKTPPNNYGNTGHNARYYDYYVQDEARNIYEDKYGDEKGRKLWEGIIYKGNAMFTACDEILGELRTMEELNHNWWYYHKDLERAAGDLQEFFRAKPSWIYNWTMWILTQMVDGKKFTHDFISSCIPTFKWFLNKYPLTFGVLLQAAGIDDIENYKLSKKVQAKVDAEAAARAEAERKAEEERLKQARIAAEKQAAADENAELVAKYGDKFGDYWVKIFMRGNPGTYIQNLFDLSVGVDNIINLPAPTNKDEQRIYDIIAKSQATYQPYTTHQWDYEKHKHKTVTKGWHYKKGETADIRKCQLRKAVDLAYDMNAKITDEGKRAKRRAAAEKYGLTFIAEKFR